MCLSPFATSVSCSVHAMRIHFARRGIPRTDGGVMTMAKRILTPIGEGEPVEEILLEAEAFDADLIAIAGRSRGRLSSAMAPGVAERLERKATVPVLTLREPSA